MINPPPTTLTPTVRRDHKHVRRLAIFHFIGSGLGVIGLFTLPAQKAMATNATGLIVNHQIWEQLGQRPPAEFVALIDTIVLWTYYLGAFFMVASIFLNLLAGMFLRHLRNRVFCLVAAGFNCMQMPPWLILGVFTFIILRRKSVQTLFEPSEPPF